MTHGKALTCEDGPNWVLTCECGNRWTLGRIKPIKKKGKWFA